MRAALIFACAAGLLLGAADGGARKVSTGNDVLRPLVPVAELETAAAIDAFEARLAELRQLPAGERRKRERRLEGELEALVERSAGTKLSNKANYLLASWRLSYRNGEGVAPLLEAIATAEYPGFKQPAQALRVQLLLRQGRLGEARAVAQAVATAVPELSGVLDLVVFHERIGQAAPRTAGTPLGGSVADPATRPEPWLLYHFTESLDDEGAYILGRYLDEARRAPPGHVRVVVVSFTAAPLQTLSALSALPGADLVDLLWANPGETGDARAWGDAWKLPSLPNTVLLGPDRSVVAVAPLPEELNQLFGGRSAPAAPTDSGGPPRKGRR